MDKKYLTNSADGRLEITHLMGPDPDGIRLDKVLFGLSCITDKGHFNPEIHTREAIAAGLDGHRPLSLLAEVEETELPTDRYFRDAWEWEE